MSSTVLMVLCVGVCVDTASNRTLYDDLSRSGVAITKVTLEEVSMCTCTCSVVHMH